MSTIRRALRIAVATTTFLLAAAAGVAIGGGGATGTGFLAFGRVTNFGSIFVNGIEFFTHRATISINGQPDRSESDLKIGMVLTVTGSVDNGGGTKGTAATVVYQADALGFVDEAPAGDTVGVMGQAVKIDASTVFDGFLSLSELRPGDLVEVSGYRSPAGLLAARIERKPNVAMSQVKGAARSVTPTTFSVGGLVVDYSHAARKNVPAGGLSEGQSVVALGPLPVGGVMAATSIEAISTSLGGNANASLGGVVASTAPGSLSLDGQVVSTTPSTQYVNGTAADVVAGATVKVDVQVSGAVVVASRIELMTLREDALVEGDVTAVRDAEFDVLGPGGATITATATTFWRDQSGARLDGFGFAQLAVGDHVQVRGTQVDVATVRADRITRLRPSTAVALSGRALGVAAPGLTVVDIAVTTDASTVYKRETGQSIDAAAFFARAAGHNVDVLATRAADGSLVATQVRID